MGIEGIEDLKDHEHEYPEDPNPPHGSNTDEEMDVDLNDSDS